MCRLFLLGVLCLAGCENTVGPFRRNREPVDNPHLPIDEQQRLGRDRLALPDNSREVAPPTGLPLPGPHGR